MKKILVPCDFSQTAMNAYRFALDVAAKSDGVVHVLNIMELPVLRAPAAVPVPNFEGPMLKELREKAAEKFKKISRKYPSKDVNVVFDVHFGTVVRSILDYIDQEGMDLVVIGSHGASGAREFFIGSNAEKVVRRAPVPVLVVKNYTKKSLKHIVFPNSLELEDQEDLVQRVKELQHFFQAKLHVVWINTPANFAPDVVTQERLTAFADRYMLHNFSLHIFNDLEEERGILRFAEGMKGHYLIAMGTHGRKGIAHLFKGSVAEDVVNHNFGLVWTSALKTTAVGVGAENEYQHH